MSKPLTAASVQKLKAASARLEIPDAGCQGLYLVIQPTGSKGWALRYRRPDGRPAKLVLGSVYAKAAEVKEPDMAPLIGGHLTLAAAHRLVSELRHEIAQGRDPAAAHIKNKQHLRTAAINVASKTFAGVARKFIDEYNVPKKGRKPRRWRAIARVIGLEYHAAGGEPSVIKGSLVDRWAEKPIDEIDGNDIHSVISESRLIGIPGLTARTEGPSDSRGRKMADALGSMFKWLIRGRVIVVNPCAGVYRPDAPDARERVLTDAEIARFWFAAGTMNQPFGPLVKLLLLTGCRLNEVAGMKSAELNQDSWTIPGSRTKNGRPHVVPLSSLACDVLSEVPRIERSDFVFTTTGVSAVSGWSKMKLRLDEAMGKPVPWRLHDLRRTVATGMAELGIAPHIVEAALNHVSGAKAGVAGIYNRAAYAKEKKVALDRWAARVERLVASRPTTALPTGGART